MGIFGQNLKSLGPLQPKLVKLSFCVTSLVKFPNFSAQPPIPLNLATPGQNINPLGKP